MMRRFAPTVAAALVLVCAATFARAADSEPANVDTVNVNATKPDRVFGVLPNYTTADPNRVTVQTTHDAFKAASLNTFDPYVYPTVATLTMFGAGNGSDYAARYSRAFADNAIGNFMTSAVVPSLTHQDSRYYRRGDGSLFSRVAYAASRSVITRTRSGEAAFNVSEIGGNAAAAVISNMYYSPAERTIEQTAARWATQVAWDTVANELKEFWPDIRTKIHKR